MQQQKSHYFEGHYIDYRGMTVQGKKSIKKSFVEISARMKFSASKNLVQHYVDVILAFLWRDSAQKF